MEQKLHLEKAVGKTFFNYVSLGIFSMAGTSLFILADTFFIANGVGAQGIAALNIVLPMVNLFNGIGWMMGVGGATLFSIAKGRGELEEGRGDFTLTLVLSLIVAAVFCALTLLFTDPILRFLGASGPIFELSKNYYTVIMAFSPVFILNNVYITFLRNDNNPKLAMAALLAGGIANIILDYIFIFPLQMGLRGAAAATVTSPAIALMVSSLHLRRESRQLAFRSFKVQLKKISQIFSIGFSSFLNEFSSAVVMLLFNIVLLQLVGSIGVSAYAIIANMNIVVAAIFTGIGQGFQPLVSHFHGAGKRAEVKKVLHYALAASLIFGIVFAAAGFLFPEVIVSVFNNEQNQLLAQLAVPGIVLYFSSFLFTGLNFSAVYFMSAVDRPRPAFIISLLRGIVLIVPALTVMVSRMEVIGVWLTMPIVETVTMIISLYVLYSYTKKYLRH